MKKMNLVIMVLLVLAIPLWIYLVAPRLTPRIPSDWEWKVSFIGYLNWADTTTNEWTKDELSLYEKSVKVIRIEKDIAVIKDIYTTYDPMTEKVTWQGVLEFTVDKNTGMNIRNEKIDRSGYYYLFPKHTEKRDYPLWYYYLKKTLFSFVKEEDIEGLKTYLFAFSGDLEYTEAYAGTEEYPGVPVEEGQEIRSGDGFTVNLWVEPVSGEVVKTEETGAVDLIVDSKTRKEIAKLTKWGGKTTGDAIVTLVSIAEARKNRIILIERYIPMGFGVVALALFLTTILGAKRKKTEKGV